MFFDLLGEILRIGIGAVCGVCGIACFCTVLRMWRNPEEHERRRVVAVAIKRYKNGLITADELKRITPPESVQFGVVFTITAPYRFVRSVRMNAHF